MRWIFILGAPAGALAMLSALLIRNRILTPVVAESTVDLEKGTEKLPVEMIPTVTKHGSDLPMSHPPGRPSMDVSRAM
jgi:hypothetical protein